MARSIFAMIPHKTMAAAAAIGARRAAELRFGAAMQGDATLQKTTTRKNRRQKPTTPLKPKEGLHGAPSLSALRIRERPKRGATCG
jgi:hypothetical protein